MSDIVTTNLDLGSPNGYLPALKILQKGGFTVTAAASSRAAAKVFFERAGLSVFELANHAHWETVAAKAEMESWLRRENPRCLVVGISGSPASSEKTAIVVAKRLGIPVIAFIESWPHRWLLVHGWRDVPIYRHVDSICIPDDLSRVRLLEEGFTPGQVIVTGNPLKDALLAQKVDATKYRAEYRSHFGIPGNATVLLYATTANLDDPNEDNPSSPEWLGYSERQAVTEFLLAIREARGGRNPQKPIVGVIRVKPSPSYSGILIQELIAKYCPDVRFDQVNFFGKAVPLFGADLIVGMSTLLVEQAGDLGKPTVCYLPNVPPEKNVLVNILKVVFPLYDEGGLEKVVRKVAYDAEGALKHILSQQIPISPIKAAAESVARVIKSHCEKK